MRDSSMGVIGGQRASRVVREHLALYTFEVFDGLPRQKDGYVDLPEGPGLGLTFNEDVADAHPYMPLGVGGRGI